MQGHSEPRGPSQRIAPRSHVLGLPLDDVGPTNGNRQTGASSPFLKVTTGLCSAACRLSEVKVLHIAPSGIYGSKLNADCPSLDSSQASAVLCVILQIFAAGIMPPSPDQLKLCLDYSGLRFALKMVTESMYVFCVCVHVCSSLCFALCFD